MTSILKTSHKKHKKTKSRIIKQENMKINKLQKQQVKEIFKNYKIYQQRLNYDKIFDVEKINYWTWYINEINLVLELMKEEESNFLKSYFLDNKSQKDLYISTSKYYMWIRLVCHNFLTQLDSVFQNFHIKKDNDSTAL